MRTDPPGAGDDADVLSMLHSVDPRERVVILREIARTPTLSSQVVRRLVELTDDTTVTVLGLPYEIGEVRWAAAEALTAERREEPCVPAIVMPDVPRPLSSQRLIELAERSGVETGAGVDGLVRTYLVLRDRGLLPSTDLRP